MRGIMHQIRPSGHRRVNQQGKTAKPAPEVLTKRDIRTKIIYLIQILAKIFEKSAGRRKSPE
jgi:hypothetical protein